MTSRYLTGEWLGVVSPAGVALLPADLGPDLVEEVWHRLRLGKGLGGVLEVLTGAFGTSLSAIPPFAVAVLAGDEVRLAVRGPLEVRATADDGGSTTVSGAGVTTWSERMLEDPPVVELAAAGAPGRGTSLALADGIVLAESVRVVRREVAASVAVSDITQDEPSVPSPVVSPFAAPSFAAPSLPSPSPVPPPVPPLAVPLPVPSARASAPDETWAVPMETDAFASAFSSPGLAGSSEIPASAPPPSANAPGANAPGVNTPGVNTPSANALSANAPSDLPPTDEYDDLWGATIARPIAEAAVHPPKADAEEPSTDPAGDHDGETISFEQLQALRAGAPGSAAPGSAAPGSVASGDPALAVPTTQAQTGRITLSTGQQAELDRAVVIGRRPRAVRVTGGVLPHLIAVDSPQQDISRSHVEVRREGDVVIVVDLNTTNGTVLLRDGAAPVRLHPGEPSIVIEGDVLDLGDGVTATFEEIG